MGKEQQALLGRIGSDRKDKAVHSYPSSSQRIADVSELHTNRPVPRDVGKGRAGSIGIGSSKPPTTSNTTVERPKPSPTIDELEDVTRQRYASSALDVVPGSTRREMRVKADIYNRSEEYTQASRPFNVARHGGTAGADPSYRVPPLPIRNRDHISAVEQERNRQKSYANIDIPSPTSPSSSSVTRNPGHTASANVPPRPAILATKKSVSFDNDEWSPEGRNGPSRPPVSHARPGVPLPSAIRPTATKKSFSFNGGVQSGPILNNWNGPSGTQDSYTRRAVPLPSGSRPIATKKSFSFDDGGFQSSSGREGWTGPSRWPSETRYESSRSPETPVEAPQSWQSSNPHNQRSLIDSPHYPGQLTDMHHMVSEGEYYQAIDRSGVDAQRKELEIRRRKEDETKRREDEIRWNDMLAKNKQDEVKREEGLARHVEKAARRFGGEERRLTQDPMWQEAGRREDEVRRKDEEDRLKEDAAYAKEEEIRRMEEGRRRREELHSLEDLTNEVQGRSPYPSASGGFGDIWKCVLVKSSRAVQVAVKTIRSFESDNEESVRKNAKRVRRELTVWGRLKHERILPLWGVANNFGPYPAMICPWADNGALTGFLERQQDKLSYQDKFSLLNDIALGLQYLHSKSVVHGDLTGSNVLINGQGRACLADFGLSTIILEFIGTSYFTNSIWGNIRWAATELYEAPENASLTTECDVYSFGSITLQVLTYKVPYYNMKNDMAVLGQVIKGKKPEPPKESQIAHGHWNFIQRCWLPRAGRPSAGDIVAFVEYERRALSF